MLGSDALTRARIAAAVVGAALGWAATPAIAVDKHWNVGTGLWGTAGNWTPTGVPGGSDAVSVAFAGGSTALLNLPMGSPTSISVFNNNVISVLNDGSLGSQTDFILGANRTTGTLSLLNNNPIFAYDGRITVGGTMRLGVSGGTGRVNQNDGIVAVAGDVYLGDTPAASGFSGRGEYSLSGIGLLQANRLYIGRNPNTGSLSLVGTLSLAGGARVNVQQLLMGLSGIAAATQTGGTMNVGGAFSLVGSGAFDGYTISGGSLTCGSSNIGGRFNYNGGAVSLGTLSVSGDIKISPHGNKVLRATRLLLNGGGSIDIANNSILLSNDTPFNWYHEIRQAYLGGSWTGSEGIGSSFAAAVATLGQPHRTAVGVGPVTGGLLIKYTYEGDANVDGVVNLQDFNRLAANFGQTNKFWYEGDFNYDQTVNLQDFNKLAGNFGLSIAGPDVTPEDWAALAAAVPEPGAGFAAAPLALIGARWRRRTRAARRQDGSELTA